MARKKLHFDQAAEQEANDIGKKFMNSQDVVGDMSRHYGADLSSVRIHHDESSARQAADRGVDAFSTGTDVFFGRGAFDRNDPASRGLLAHELSHSLQQGVGGGQPAVAQSAPMGAQQGGIIDWFRQHRQKRKLKKAGNFMDREQQDRNLMWFWNNSIQDDSATASKTASLTKYLNKTLGKDKHGNFLLRNTLHNSDKSSEITGLVGSRLASSLAGALGGGRSKRQIGKLYKDLYAGQMAAAKSNGPLSDKKKADVDMRYGRGIESLKGVYLEQLRRMRDKYGTYGTQLHPDDFLSRAGVDYFDDHSLIQDVQQLMVDAPDHLDYDNSADDRELRDLGNYYFNVFNIHNLYSTSDPLLMDEQNMDIHPDPEAMEFLLNNDNVMAAYDQEKLVHGPGMSKEEHQQYLEHLRKSYVQSGHQDRLFGRFL